MTITKAQLIATFPEFANVTEAQVTAVNVHAALFVDSSAFGEAEEYGLMLMIAHILKFSELSGGNTVLSESVGELSRSYGNPQTQGYLGMTGYGRMFMELVRGVVVPTSPFMAI